MQLREFSCQQLDDCLDLDVAAIEASRLAGLLSFDRRVERGLGGNAHQFMAIEGEEVGRDGDDELPTGNPDDRSF